MKPDEYMRAYAEPLLRAGSPRRDGDALPFLDAERLYSDHEKAHYMYSFTIENLTRDELLRMVRETGIGEPSAVTPGQLIGWIREKDRLLAEQHGQLIELQQIAAAHDRLMASREHRVFQMIVRPARLAMRAFRRLRLF